LKEPSLWFQCGAIKDGPEHLIIHPLFLIQVISAKQ
jgi:hypothetical protein